MHSSDNVEFFSIVITAPWQFRCWTFGAIPIQCKLILSRSCAIRLFFSLAILFFLYDMYFIFSCLFQ